MNIEAQSVRPVSQELDEEGGGQEHHENHFPFGHIVGCSLPPQAQELAEPDQEDWEQLDRYYAQELSGQDLLRGMGKAPAVVSKKISHLSLTRCQSRACRMTAIGIRANFLFWFVEYTLVSILSKNFQNHAIFDSSTAKFVDVVGGAATYAHHGIRPRGSKYGQK